MGTGGLLGSLRKSYSSRAGNPASLQCLRTFWERGRERQGGSRRGGESGGPSHVLHLHGTLVSLLNTTVHSKGTHSQQESPDGRFMGGPVPALRGARSDAIQTPLAASESNHSVLSHLYVGVLSVLLAVSEGLPPRLGFKKACCRHADTQAYGLAPRYHAGVSPLS